MEERVSRAVDCTFFLVPIFAKKKKKELVSDSLSTVQQSTSKIHLFYFGYPTRCVGSYFPHQGLNLHFLNWKHRVLTAESPGKSQGVNKF